MAKPIKQPLIDYKEITAFLKYKFPQASNIIFENILIKGDSLVVKADLRYNKGKVRRLWVKIDKNFFDDEEKARKIAEDSYHLLSKLYDDFSGEDNFAIVKPLCFWPQWAAVITEDAPGVPLSSIVYKYVFSLNKFGGHNKKRVTEILSNCGKWVAKFQETTGLDKELKGFELDFLKDAEIKRDLSFLKYVGVSKKTTEVLRDYLFKHLPFVNGLTQKGVGCHVDFSPRNIIVGKNNKITLLDFEKFSYRWPYDNLAIFMVYLDSFRKYLLVDKNKLENLKEFFLQGYKSKTQHNIDEKILHFFYTRYMLIMVANELTFVKKRKPFIRWLILNRMRSILEFWVNKNILR
ncbi:MAG: aminoglycoside phosphotransferase family protein [Omnitrophica bacterium]|nr:aminoglycoside phosphotransferase family protein [Candidatus Omnitrophota bacterium]